jgi:hypothetical protein
MRSLLVLVLATSTLAAPAPAYAQPTKEACREANTRGQDLRRGGKLSLAREQLRACGSAECPNLVRDDCARRLDELENAQPTIIFEAKDDAGNDLSEVEVEMDGAPLVHKLDGAALSVDPGEHIFAFTATGHASLSRKLVLAEGEKARHEVVVIAFPPRPPVPSAPEPAPSPRPAAPSTNRVLALVVGGAGLAGIVLGSVYGVTTFSEVNQQNTDCASASSCPNHSKATSDHNAATNDGTISTVAFVAGGALLVTGVALFLTARASDSVATPALVASPILAPGGGGIALSGRF